MGSTVDSNKNSSLYLQLSSVMSSSTAQCMNASTKVRPRGDEWWNNIKKQSQLARSLIPEAWIPETRNSKTENYICLFTRKYNFKYNIISSLCDSMAPCEIMSQEKSAQFYCSNTKAKKLVCNEQHAHGSEKKCRKLKHKHQRGAHKTARKSVIIKL